MTRMAALAAGLALASIVAKADLPARSLEQIPEKFTNLQVLPKNITRQELVPIMRNFALGIGIRCEHCHVGEGNDLSKFDFASDARPAKAVARKMLQMVATLNAQWPPDVGAPLAPGAARVTCFTCHRGSAKPLTSPGL